MKKYFNLAILIKDFIKYWFIAKTIYEIDSPLIYDFCNEVLDSQAALKTPTTSNYIELCKRDYSKVVNTDIGESSKISSNTKTISQIARTSSSSLTKCHTLIKIAKWNGSKTVLELGTNLGVAASAFVEMDFEITTVEGHDQLYDIAFGELSKYKNCSIDHSLFDTYLEKCQETYDLVIIDGDHSYHSTLALVEKCSELLNPNGLIVIDDIRWSDGMKKAWQKLRDYSSYNLCIDLFMIGIIGNKKELKSKIDIKLLPRRYKPWPYHFFRRH